MTLSNNAITMIADFEKFRAKAYLDSKRVPTIGYGSTVIDGVPVKLGDTITQEKAWAALHADCHERMKKIQRLVKVPVTQNQVDALLSFAYNVGVSGFSASTLLKRLNAGQTVTADMFLRWNKITDPVTGKLVVLDGLTTRRQREFELFDL
jgi:lysozyme